MLREARRVEPGHDLDDKLRAITRAAQCSFPAPDIDQMLAESVEEYAQPLPE